MKRVGSQGEMMAAFEASGRRITPQRRAMLDYVAGRSDHLSARQIRRGLPIPPEAIRSEPGFEAVQSLVPKNEAQQAARANARELMLELGRTRMLLCRRRCRARDLRAHDGGDGRRGGHRPCDEPSPERGPDRHAERVASLA